VMVCRREVEKDSAGTSDFLWTSEVGYIDDNRNWM
jgi:hypothetical protein